MKLMHVHEYYTSICMGVNISFELLMNFKLL